jgi:thiosulfate/3-mercaptopyruvate sulfurtransferase
MESMMMTDGSLIDVEQLAANLGSDNLVVADCRFALADASLGRRQYDAGHVPGAHFFDLQQDLSAPVGKHGGRHPLPDHNLLGARLVEAGVNPDSLVVAYDDSRLGFAARFWWLLRYLGHRKVRVLNGGFKAWTSAGLPVSVQSPPLRRGTFLPRPNRSAIVSREEVLALVSARDHGTNLVDARELKRFLGEEEPIDPVAGRIPGARCYPWQDYTNADGFVISDDANRQRWTKLDPDRKTILYCGSGVTACVNALSLDAVGISNVRIYPGSFSDWCSYPDSPIAVGDG